MKITIQNCKKMTKKRPSGIAGASSLFQWIPVFLKTLFLGSKPNFPNPRNTTTPCSGSPYNDFHPQTNKKSKPNPNPIKANFKTQKESILSLIERQNKPNSNPKQTQYKPKPNPKQTQTNPIRDHLFHTFHFAGDF